MASVARFEAQVEHPLDFGAATEGRVAVDPALDRIDEPEKNWKFSFGDLEERKLWDRYMEAYEDMIRNTAREYAPWHVVPSDSKWFSRLVISAALVEALERIDPQFPELSEEDRQKMKDARDSFAGEIGKKAG